MTLLDALNNDELDVRVTCGDRWLTAHVDDEGQCFTVYEQTKRMKSPRCLVETANEDESCRYLISEKG